MLPTLNEIRLASGTIYRQMPATPQNQWPLLSRRIGVDLWLKHENYTPLGAFKVRGGIVYFDALTAELRKVGGVICATRGNHGQSVARAATTFDIPATIVVPFGNSPEKNAAMKSFGGKLIEHGTDFQEAYNFAQTLAIDEGLHLVPSFHSLLVTGVSTYSLELLEAVGDLDVVYVPIGLGSGICGTIAARNGLGRKTEIVGVVSSSAPAYKISFDSGRSIESPVTTRIADGVACSRPNEEALASILKYVSRVVTVSDDQVEQAMRDVFECTHNVAEGAAAATVAAIAKEREQLAGKRVAAVITGQNVDREVFAKVLTGPVLD